MINDQVNPAGELAAAIKKAVETLWSHNDPYCSLMRVALMELDRTFKRTQGSAEYDSWFRKEAA